MCSVLAWVSQDRSLRLTTHACLCALIDSLGALRNLRPEPLVQLEWHHQGTCAHHHHHTFSLLRAAAAAHTGADTQTDTQTGTHRAPQVLSLTDCCLDGRGISLSHRQRVWLTQTYTQKTDTYSLPA